MTIADLIGQCRSATMARDQQTKLPTLVRGLDEVLAGGLPKARTTVINGGTGTGKTVLGLEIAYRNAEAGRSAIYLSLEESADAIRSNASTVGWDLARLEADGLLRILDPRIEPKAIRIGEYSLGGLRGIVEGSVREADAVLIVLDALDTAFGIFDSDARQEEELIRLMRWLSDKRITAILTAKRFEPGEGSRLLDFLADCVIDLDQRVDGQVATRRLRVVKYRGSGYLANEHPFLISPSGIAIMPIGSIELDHAAPGPPIATGFLDLDSLLGRGLLRGTGVLVAGPTGSGKTTIACTIAVSAAARGERVLYISLEESIPALTESMRSPGIDLSAPIEEGTLRIVTAMPESLGIEAHLFRIIEAMDAYAPAHIILDAVSATSRMGSESAAFEFLVRIISETKRRGVTCILTSQTRYGSAGHSDLGISEVGVSSLIDTIILLRFTVEETEAVRELATLKSRGTAHATGYRRFTITDAGLRLVSSEAKG